MTRKFRLSNWTALAAIALAVSALAVSALGGCSNPFASDGRDSALATDGGVAAIASPDLASAPNPAEDPQLTGRKLDYNLALRSAAIKLVGDLPTLDEQRAIQSADDQRSAYEKRIDAYLADPRFTDQLLNYFRNTFKMGGMGGDEKVPVSFETAPTFAARLVVLDKPFTDLFTASANTCPTYGNGVFTDGDCNNGVPAVAGVLSDPGVHTQFVSNMAFRRVRWLQETFDCRRFPVEYGKTPTPMGAGNYTSPWPFQSIAGGDTGRVDFHDTKSVVCANCHTTMNHLAPLFANFDAHGVWQADIQVTVPVTGQPKANLSDWLPAGETTAWRFGVPANDLPALGQALAHDPDVTACTVTRVYDWAMSKDDVVLDLATVPDQVIAPYFSAYEANGHKLKAVIRQAFTSDDFVRF